MPVSEDPRQGAYVKVGDSVKLPSFLPQFQESSFLNHIWVQLLETNADANKISARTKVFIDSEVVLSLPGCDAVALTVGAEDGGTVIPVEVEIKPQLFVRLSDIPLRLRLKTDLFKPARRVGASQPDKPPIFERDPDRSSLDIALARVALELNAEGGIQIKADASIDLPPTMLGDRGVVIEAQGLSLHFDPDNPPRNKPIGWTGVHLATASLHLPGELAGIVGSLTLTDCYIGNGGFSGTVTDEWKPALSASLFGLRFELQSVTLTFTQNSLTAGSITGQVTLPFFETPIQVEVCPTLNGPLLVRLKVADGVIELKKEGIFSLTVDSLGFGIDGGVFSAKISGKIRPLLGGLSWPSFEIRELAIDSQGNVRLQGGWLDLPNQYKLDFHGFQLEITQMGFGRHESGGRWIGFSGGLKLVDGLAAGASVEGLRLTWYDDGRKPDISLGGVGVDFLIPDTLRFHGAIAYRERTVGAETVHQFDGRIRLELISLSLTVDATLVVGTSSGPPAYVFLGIYMDCQLPSGIPLFSTGLALYGMAGLFALNMEPARRPDEPWYDGWYKRPQSGVTDLANKWINRNQSLALGAGITLGTVSDNGYCFSGNLLLVIIFPGPILLLEGKANILHERSKLDDEPIFRALAVLDGRAGSLLFGLDAQYKYGNNAELIEISGGVEAFFSFHDPSAWHLYIGMRTPRSKRVRASIFRLFESSSYFMLDAKQVAMGTWVGYDQRWDFGPLRVVVQAWLEGNASLSWKPVHLHGDLWLHGRVELSVFGFGLALGLDARFDADVFDPFHILASFSVEIDLPWPLPSFGATIKLEWGPEKTPPPLPIPVKEIAIEHFKVSESWPLPRTGPAPLLLPNWDGGQGFRKNLSPAEVATQVTAQGKEPPPSNSPIVPLDGRPHITFGRSVHDLALVGVNAQPVNPPYERIGDPAKNEGPVKVKYGLTEITLDRYVSGNWSTVARKAITPNDPGVPAIYGSWAPVPQMPDGNGENVSQTKLWLWSKSAFDYTRHSGRDWEDWFTDRFDRYPCIPPAREHTECCNFRSPDIPFKNPL